MERKKFYGSIGKDFVLHRKMPKSVLKILNICNSGKFLNYLEDITGEKGLIPDPYYIGGGIHSTVNNGFLEMHADLIGMKN